MFGLNVGLLKNNKYVRYGTISTVVAISVMGVSYMCYSRVKNDVLEKIKNFGRKNEKKRIIDENKLKEDNVKDNKENN